MSSETPSTQIIIAALEELLSAATRDDTRRILEQHPELLTDQSEAVLTQATDTARAQGDENAVRIFTRQRNLLRRCREVGIKWGIGEKGLEWDTLSSEQRRIIVVVSGEFVFFPTWHDSRRILEQHPELLSDKVDEMYTYMIRTIGREDLAPLYVDHRDLLRRCREVGVEKAFDEKIADVTSLPPEQQHALETAEAIYGAHPKPWVVQQMLSKRLSAPHDISPKLTRLLETIARTLPNVPREQLLSLTAAAVELIAAADLPECRRILERYPELLSDHADVVMTHLREDAIAHGYEDWADLYIEKQDLVHLCREVGVEEAFIRQQTTMPFSERVDSELRGLAQHALATEQHYLRSDDYQALDSVATAWDQVVSHSTFTAAPLLFRLSVLGHASTALHRHYLAKGQSSILDTVIRYLEEMQALMHPASPDLPQLWINLGNALRDKYLRMGSLPELDRAIEILEKALRYMYLPSPNLPHGLTILGNCLRDYYAQTGDLAYLTRAIKVYTRAVDEAPSDSPHLPIYLNNLGHGLHDHYFHTKTPEDLGRAIEAWDRAVQLTLPNSPDLPMRLNNLGLGFRERYMYTGDLLDLQRTLELAQRAVCQAPPESPDLPMYLNNLGLSLQSWYEHTKELKYLERAVEVGERAVHLTSREAPSLPGRLLHLAASFHWRYLHIGNAADCERAIDVYRESALRGLQVSPEKALQAARSWGDWAVERQAWAEAAEAFGYGLHAIDRLFQTQLLKRSKETWLQKAQGLPGKTAYALARTGDLQGAVEALEQGRARLLAEALVRSWADLETLKSLRPDVYERYRRATERVVRMATEDFLPMPFTAAFDPTVEARIAHADLDAAVEVIRRVHGYENFLKSPTFADIQAILASAMEVEGLVYLVTTSAGSLALIVTTAGVEEAWLDFNEQSLNAILVKHEGTEVAGGYLPGQVFGRAWLQQSLIEALPILGERVMALVAARLHALGIKQIVLIPAGRLALLPLHAAHYPVEGREVYFLDEFTISYTPNARSLATSQREAQRRGSEPSLVGVGNPLPDRETAAWAWAELQQVLPNLGGIVRDLKAQHSPLTAAYEATLERLEALVKAPSESLIHAGSVFQQAAVLFGLLPDKPGVMTLHSVASRILPNLPYAKTELRSIVGLLPTGTSTRLLYEEKATRQAVLDAIPGTSRVHLSCHGIFQADDPLESSLFMADGRLSLRDILSVGFHALDAARLVILSACQTAVIDFSRLPDEAVGLATGFLHAGVPGVVATLWPVSDLSTALVMTKFYEYHLHGRLATGEGPMSPVRALRRAQQWLRDVTCAELSDSFDKYRRAASDRPQIDYALAQERFQYYTLRPSNEQPFADPYDWAALTFHGV